MKKLILHPGLHKTGTSAIQASLNLNRSKLLDFEVYYPSTEPFDAHHRLASRIKEQHDNELRKLDILRTFGEWSTKSDTILVSSEIFSECADVSCLSVLGEIFHDIEIVFYIREQIGLLGSAYNQQVKQNGETRRFEEYKPYFTSIYENIKQYRKALPQSRIKVFNYDKKALHDGDVVSDFYKNVLSMDSSIFRSISNEVNSSLSPLACMVMAKINSLELDNSVRNEILDVISKEFPIKKYSMFSFISDECISIIDKESKVSNDKLRLEYKGLSDFKLNLNHNKFKYYLNEELVLSLCLSSRVLNIIGDMAGMDKDSILSRFTRVECK